MKPSSPRVLLNIALGLVLGSLLAAGAALVAERFDRRVHSSDDLLEGTGIAVLAELPRARVSTRRHRRAKRLRSRGMEPRIEPA
jgi:succinoglycan biosynthesis transport protein ExoP